MRGSPTRYCKLGIERRDWRATGAPDYPGWDDPLPDGPGWRDARPPAIAALAEACSMGKQACVDLMAQDPATAGAWLAQAAGVTEQEVPKALADNEWTDPCTGEPLDWDPAARAIVFTGQGRTRQGEYAIVY